MSKTWKWILGIVIGLVVLAGVGFVAANYFGFGHMAYYGRTAYFNHPMMDDHGFGTRDFRQPMMGGRGFYPFGGFFFLGGLLRLIFPLGILALVGYFSYRAGKKAGMNDATQNAPKVEPVIDTKTDSEESPKEDGRKFA